MSGWRLALGLGTCLLLGQMAIEPASAGSSFATLYRFQGLQHGDGSLPLGLLVRDRAGVIYGTTKYGGLGSSYCGTGFAGFDGCGTVFRIAPPRNGGKTWHESVIYRFQGLTNGATDGTEPEGGVIRGPAGLLYGTTLFGGSAGNGTVFMLAPPASGKGPWSESVLYSFQGGSDGEEPIAGLTFGPTGTLYGTTIIGGSGLSCSNCGTVFQLVLANGTWTESVIHAFNGNSDGQDPRGPVTVDKSGAILGLTFFGGDYDRGTAFKLVNSGGNWNSTAIYQFPGYLWSANPNLGALFPLKSGTFVGLSEEGGDQACGGCGTVFTVAPPSATVDHWVYQVIHRFHGGGDGAFPQAGLVMDKAGALYGATSAGGSDSGCSGGVGGTQPEPAVGIGLSGCGTIFKLIPPRNGKGPWPETVLHHFTGGIDGSEPQATLLIDDKGVLFGTTISGGLSCPQDAGCGTVFMLKP